MAKKSEKQDGITITIPQNMMDALGIDKDSSLDMIIIDDALIIKPRNKAEAKKKRQKQFENSINRLMDKYEPVLKKLAKT